MASANFRLEPGSPLPLEVDRNKGFASPLPPFFPLVFVFPEARSHYLVLAGLGVPRLCHPNSGIEGGEPPKGELQIDTNACFSLGGTLCTLDSVDPWPVPGTSD